MSEAKTDECREAFEKWLDSDASPTWQEIEAARNILKYISDKFNLGKGTIVYLYDEDNEKIKSVLSKLPKPPSHGGEGV